MLDDIGVDVRDVLSTRSRAYQARRAEIDAMSDDDLIQAIVDEPTLIRRPILVAGGAYVIGARKTDLESFTSKLT